MTSCAQPEGRVSILSRNFCKRSPAPRGSPRPADFGKPPPGCPAGRTITTIRAAARLEAACGALAALHRVWGSIDSTKGACPAVRRRLARFEEWKGLLASGWRPDFGDSRDPTVPAAQRAWAALLPRADRIPDDLSEWANQRMPLQPCLCDVWHDHVLFEGDAVSGVVDYGGVKVDHVAIDLARLLGSLVEDDVEARAIGLRAYRARPSAFGRRLAPGGYSRPDRDLARFGELVDLALQGAPGV